MGVIFDISDLLIFISVHGFVTGIQRVQLEILAAALADDRSPAGQHPPINFCYSQFGRAWSLQQRNLDALLAYAQSGQVDAETARALVRRARANARLCRLPAGSVYLVLGAFWGDPDLGALCARVRRHGVSFGVLVHDLFPITMPALCEEGAAAVFETKLRAGLATWDFIVANSRFTASEIRRFRDTRGFDRNLAILAVPLAHHHTRPAPPRAALTLPAVLAGRRFVLCVGTIEPRKNHDRLIKAWVGLGRAHKDLPDLVLVGRRGWKTETMSAPAEIARLAGKKIHWLETVSDPELDALYAECLFTVFPSLAEGWGLPIGEALAHGKVCLASSAAAMPEVGGPFADYVSPTNTAALQSALEQLIYDDAHRLKRERLIQDAFHPRTWTAVTADLIAALAIVTPRPVKQARPASAGPRKPQAGAKTPSRPIVPRR